MASGQTARARWTCAADYDSQNAAGRSPGRGRGEKKMQRLNGQPIRGRASLPRACVIFDPWQRSKTSGGELKYRPERPRRGETEALRDRDRQEDAETAENPEPCMP